jgi:hypothetical protein
MPRDERIGGGGIARAGRHDRKGRFARRDRSLVLWGYGALRAHPAEV